MKPTTKDDQPFHHYTMKHRAVAWLSQTLFDNVTYTVRHGLIKGMQRKGGLAWLPEFLTGSIRTPEYSFWLNHALEGLVIYDIGAFQGLLTLFLARRGREVISYEPNARNHARLLENLRLNGVNNVLVRNVGIGSKPGFARMVASPLMPGGASIEPETVAGLLQSDQPALSEEIFVTTLDDDIQKMSLPPPDFIKLDIEGAELDALAGARNTLLRHKPQVFVELHGETMNLKRKNVAAVVACLNEVGYRKILHVETETRIDANNCMLAAEGHLYCQAGGAPEP